SVQHRGLGPRERWLSESDGTGDDSGDSVFPRTVGYVRAHLHGESFADGLSYNSPLRAGVAQLVESELPKLKVAGSIPVARSNAQRRDSICIPSPASVRCCFTDRACRNPGLVDRFQKRREIVKDHVAP